MSRRHASFGCSCRTIVAILEFQEHWIPRRRTVPPCSMDRAGLTFKIICNCVCWPLAHIGSVLALRESALFSHLVTDYEDIPACRHPASTVACSLMTDLSAAIRPGKPAQSSGKLARSQCSAHKNDERACSVDNLRLHSGLRHHFSSHAAILLSSLPTDRLHIAIPVRQSSFI